MKPLFEWSSNKALALIDAGPSGPQWFMGRYGRRKQAALLCQEGSVIRAVAYFKSEADAKRFADALFGGVRASK